MQRVIFDTEFTRFESPELLSIGLVTEDGQSECYLELLDAKREREASDFVVDNVLPLFGLVPGARVASLKELGLRLAAFLDGLPGDVELCHDYDLDWAMLVGALKAARRWEALAGRLLPRDIQLEVSSEESEEAAAAVHDADPDMRHHALTDAKALRAAWLARSRA